eukprot:4825588-Alexandrium_andersonii.AAC.1
MVVGGRCWRAGLPVSRSKLARAGVRRGLSSYSATRMPGITWSWRTTAPWLPASTSITVRRLLGRGC